MHNDTHAVFMPVTDITSRYYNWNARNALNRRLYNILANTFGVIYWLVPNGDEVERVEGKEVAAVEEKYEGRPARQKRTGTSNGGQTR